MSPAFQDKLVAARQLIAELEGVVVAYSGGVDSTLLLAIAVQALGPEKVVAAIGVSPSLAPSEHSEGLLLAKDLGATVVEVPTHEMDDPQYAANPPDRCYHCKKHLFGTLQRVAAEHGLEAVIEGSNKDDDLDYRPGRRSIKELGIRSPLLEAGMTKSDIRAALRFLDLPVWDKPAQACLASRIPYGQTLTPTRLSRVGRAEARMRELGFLQLRVRDWKELAVIEVAPEELDRLFAKETRLAVVAALKEEGYLRVTLDPEGYRMGSLNEALDLD